MATQKRKIGKVLLGKFDGSDKWEVRFLDKETGKYVRRRLAYTSFQDAKAEAERINLELMARSGWSAGLDRQDRRREHTVREAVVEAINASDTNALSKKDYLNRFNVFNDWLAADRRGVRRWSDVTPKVLIDYVAHCKAKDLSYDTVRQRYQLLGLTARFMAKIYPEKHRNVSEGIQVTRNGTARSEVDPKERILTPAQLRAYLCFLEKDDPMVWAWASLEG